MTANKQLQKNLGIVHVFAIASGAMISSGLFVLPGLAHATAGPAAILSYFLAGILAAAGTLSIAELTTAMPKAGGDYFFIMRTFGPGAGSITGLLSWFSLSLKSAFAIVGMTTFISLIINLNPLITGMVLCTIFTLINLLGVHQAARVQVLLVIGIFTLLTLYIIAALAHIQTDLLQPFIPNGWTKVFSATAMVFISYGGLLKIAGIAEEVRNPGRTITLGILLSLTITALFYVAVVCVTSGILPAEDFDNSLTPISDGGKIILGQTGYTLMSIGAVLAFISTANAGIMSASRYLLALSRDELLPEKLSKVSSKFGTPYNAIFITGIVIFLSLLLPLETLAKSASAVLILTFIMSCLSVIILRQSKLHNYKPQFNSPLYPWIQIAGIISYVLLLITMEPKSFLVSGALIFTGFLFYWFYGRRYAKQEYALLHIIERITDKKLVSGSLEKELKAIIRDRDELVIDMVDCLFEQSLAMDIEDHIKADKLFDLVAEKLARAIETDAAALAAKLKEREKQNSTALDDSLAIPHVVIDGEKKFQLLLIRAKQGAEFSRKYNDIKAIVVVVGTADNRDMHLRTLSAVVQVFRSSEFKELWMNATNDQGLRDTVLLSERKRGRRARCDLP